MSEPGRERDAARPAEEPLAYRAVRGGLWVAFSSYVNVGFGFVANLILTRLLLPDHFGVYGLAFFFYQLLNLRAKTGAAFAFARHKENTGELVGTFTGLELAGGALTLALAAVAVPVLQAVGYAPAVAWAMLALAGVGVVQSFTTTAAVLLDKELQFRRSSLVSSVVFPLSYLPAFALAAAGAGYWSLVAQNLAHAILIFFGLWWAARRHLPHVFQLRWRFDRSLAAAMLRFGLPVGLATLMGMLLTNLDNFMVGTFVGVAALGFYDRAYRLAQWPHLLVGSVLDRAAFYTYSRLYDMPAQLQKTASMMLWLIAVVTLPVALAIFLAAPHLVHWLYGERYSQSILYLRFLVVYSALRPLLENGWSLFVATGETRRRAVAVAGQVALLAALGLPLTRAWGVVGTCIAVGIAFIAGIAYTYRHVTRRVALNLWDCLGGPLVAVALALAGNLLLLRVVDMGGWLLWARAAFIMPCAALTFAATLLVIQRRATVARASYVWRLLRARNG